MLKPIAPKIRITKKLITSKLKQDKYKHLIKWQRDAVVSAFVTKRTFLFVPRQNGKTECILAFISIAYELGLRVCYTTHSVGLLAEMFGRLYTYLDEEKHKFKALDGRQEVDPKKKSTPGYIRFINRNRLKVGLTFDIVAHDEGQFIEPKDMQAFAPMMITSKYRIQVVTGTPPSKSDVGYWIRDQYKKRQGNWIIYGADNEEAAEEQMLTTKVQPSLGTLIDKEAVIELAASLDKESVLSEVCGVWHSDNDLRLFKNYQLWTDGGKLKALHIGIKVSPAEQLSVGCIGTLESGERVAHYLWCGDQDIGLKHLIDFLKARRVMSITADTMVKESLAGIRGIKFVDTRQFFEHTERFRQHIEQKLLYIDDQKELIECMACCAKRKKKEQVGFGFQSTDLEVNVEPLEALALACKKI